MTEWKIKEFIALTFLLLQVFGFVGIFQKQNLHKYNFDYHPRWNLVLFSFNLVTILISATFEGQLEGWQHHNQWLFTHNWPLLSFVIKCTKIADGAGFVVDFAELGLGKTARGDSAQPASSNIFGPAFY